MQRRAYGCDLTNGDSKIILAGFINNPKHIVFLGCRITQRHVDFAFLERDRITIVVHADDQLFCLCLCHGLKAGA
jgi:hypothetical protein